LCYARNMCFIYISLFLLFYVQRNIQYLSDDYLSQFWIHLFIVFSQSMRETFKISDIAGGYLCFIVSILGIGVVTAIIGDVASYFGCTLGIKDSVTAVVFVALGTSIPGKYLKIRDNVLGKRAILGEIVVLRKRLTYLSSYWFTFAFCIDYISLIHCRKFMLNLTHFTCFKRSTQIFVLFWHKMSESNTNIMKKLTQKV